MKIQSALFCVLLLISPSMWAVDTPAADSPVVTDVELPPAFIEAQSIPVPEKSNEPAEPPKPPADILPYQLEVGTSYGILNNGYADWSSLYVNAEMKLASRNNIYGAARSESRYSKNDKEVMGGFYDPIDEHFTMVVEGSASPEHNFLPTRSLLVQLEYAGVNGWGGGTGVRHADYNNAELNLWTVTVERSWGNYRAAYTRFQGILLGSGTANSSQIQAAKYYGDHNWYGVTISDGRELETLPTTQVLSSHVRTVVASGLHWFRPKVGLTYTVGNYRQGNFYIRNGIQLGLRYQF